MRPERVRETIMRCITPSLAPLVLPDTVSRRIILTGLAVAGVCAVSQPGTSQVKMLTRRGTPQLMAGPFYPLNRLTDEDADLTRIAGKTGQASGTIIDLIGHG